MLNLGFWNFANKSYTTTSPCGGSVLSSPFSFDLVMNNGHVVLQQIRSLRIALSLSNPVYSPTKCFVSIHCIFILYIYYSYILHIFYGWILPGHSILVDLTFHWSARCCKYVGILLIFCLCVIQLGELANLHVPPKLNKKINLSKATYIFLSKWQNMQTAYLEKNNQPTQTQLIHGWPPFRRLSPVAVPTPWFPPPRGASPTCCPACARWDPPLEHVGNGGGEKTATSPIWTSSEERLRKHIFEMEVASDFQVEHPSRA